MPGRFTLTEVEARVLGCLVEKEIATPDYYPMTLNSVTAACNQKSNRDPVLQLDEKEVASALDEMRYRRHLVHQVTVTGSRVPKYRHDLLKHCPFTPGQLAVVCELLVRGPQTLGELRTHASRLFAFKELTEVEQVVQELEAWGGGPLVVKLPREAGRRERRYAHLLCGEIPIADGGDAAPTEPGRTDGASTDSRIADLESQVAALRAELDEMKATFDRFRSQFG
jgi:hypothetical protein